MTADGSVPSTAPDALRRSPLAARSGDLAAASSDAVRLAEWPFRTQLDLRVDPGSPAAQRVADVLGAALPVAGRAVGDDRRAALWLGPDEWLIVAPEGAADDLVAELLPALAGEPGGVVDVSAHRTTVLVSGPAAPDVLATGVSIDLHPRSFGPGRVAVTLLARIPVILWQVGPGVDTEPSYRLLVGNSFAGYLADWLMDAGLEPASGET